MLAARGIALLLLAALALPGGAAAQAEPLPRSGLAVRQGGTWQSWWRSEAAPDLWREALAPVAGAVRWRRARPGLEWGELRLAGRGEAWRVRVVLVRLDPLQFDLQLREATRLHGLLGAWTTDSLSPDAVLGLNAGQFTGGTPWGWVISGGRELQPPGSGPLSMAVVIDSTGGVRLIEAGAIASARAAGGVRQAFQSYPTLLTGEGEVPPQLRQRGRGVDLEHRDARLAVGELRDGRLLLALTRFEGIGGLLSELPFGLTTPEMAALMGALGCRRAVMLDGGLSAQLVLRGPSGQTHSWNGLRRVPLALELFPRDGGATPAVAAAGARPRVSSSPR